MTQTMRRPLGSASDQVRAEPSASLRLLPSTATGCTRPDARRTRHFCVRVLEAGRSSVCSEARSLCPLVVSWAAPGDRQTDCACADCSSCRGAPGCASAKRWRWPKATSSRHAERSWCAAARAASPATWEWTNGPRCRCSAGWPPGRRCQSEYCPASSTAQRAGGHGRRLGRGGDQHAAALASRERSRMRRHAAGMGEITTEIGPAGPFSCAGGRRPAVPAQG
jgi:hypothetical protein